MGYKDIFIFLELALMQNKTKNSLVAEFITKLGDIFADRY